jgi:hypothetical protein
MWAIIEDNKVINIVVDIDPKELENNPTKYINYTDGWDYDNGIDGGNFFPKIVEIDEATNTFIEPTEPNVDTVE